MRDNSIFKQGLKELNIELTETQLEQFEVYYDMLVEKNKVMNLTAITEYEDVLIKHFLDSLSIVKTEKAKKLLFSSCCLIDVGTGAGFPGIPLKIAFPKIKVTLMDALNKRINFLNEVISALDLKDIEAVHGRGEELARKDQYRERFDLAVSRAVAKLNSLSELCIPFVKVGGLFVPYKSGSIDEELEEGKNALYKLGGRSTHVVKFTVPLSDYERSLIVVEKKSNTPAQFPRAGGKVFNKPL
ncbi:MAG: 16S rRNA (guanine(527)-N(7))-methyltransferase RsmG [Lachnospiraceae bacterium]|nr:16S rRNA (guanine(527)-N(7))-methyltransferase RsmG [Lachnospiraceae bacterium]